MWDVYAVSYTHLDVYKRQVLAPIMTQIILGMQPRNWKIILGSQQGLNISIQWLVNIQLYLGILEVCIEMTVAV